MVKELNFYENEINKAPTTSTMCNSTKALDNNANS